MKYIQDTSKLSYHILTAYPLEREVEISRQQCRDRFQFVCDRSRLVLNCQYNVSISTFKYSNRNTRNSISEYLTLKYPALGYLVSKYPIPNILQPSTPCSVTCYLNKYPSTCVLASHLKYSNTQPWVLEFPTLITTDTNNFTPTCTNCHQLSLRKLRGKKIAGSWKWSLESSVKNPLREAYL